MTDTYWTGPYGILVPAIVSYVVAEDGHNTMYCNGSVTDRVNNNAALMNADIYRQKYAWFNASDNQWYYQRNKWQKI
jgi:hypothetical protein